jgi:hypothetical protein
MAWMPGRFGRPWCPVCRRPPGLDCPGVALSKKQVRQRLKRELRRNPAEA